MYIKKPSVFRAFRQTKWLFGTVVFCMLFVQPAAALSLEDSFNLSHFVPLVLESMMTIATSLYDFFVGKGTGLIYVLIYLYLGFHIGLYLAKMYLPKDWLGFFGFSGGGEMWSNEASGWSIAENIGKPCLRAIIACLILLQIKPTYVTEWIIDPFLEFGSVYTEQVLKIANVGVDESSVPTCPASIADKKWLTKRGCDFLVRPVHVISHENNRVIKYGLKKLKQGVRGTMTIIPHGGEAFLNLLTGGLLVSAFVSSNLFMALLIIQAIFDFCLSLIMYPFCVLTWVAKKPEKDSGWLNLTAAFGQIIDALKKLIITMIACAFILCINVAVVRALFNWSSSAFSAATGGMASTNFATNAGGNFGGNIILCISSILTFFLMQSIFNTTRERLDMYTKGTKHDLYNNVTSDMKTAWGKVKSTPNTVKTLWQAKDKIKGILGH